MHPRSQPPIQTPSPDLLSISDHLLSYLSIYLSTPCDERRARPFRLSLSLSLHQYLWCNERGRLRGKMLCRLSVVLGLALQCATVSAWGYCNDNDLSCAMWANNKECEGDNAAVVKAQCPHSCSVLHLGGKSRPLHNATVVHESLLHAVSASALPGACRVPSRAAVKCRWRGSIVMSCRCFLRRFARTSAATWSRGARTGRPTGTSARITPTT